MFVFPQFTNTTPSLSQPKHPFPSRKSLTKLNIFPATPFSKLITKINEIHLWFPHQLEPRWLETVICRGGE